MSAAPIGLLVKSYAGDLPYARRLKGESTFAKDLAAEPIGGLRIERHVRL